MQFHYLKYTWSNLTNINVKRSVPLFLLPHPVSQKSVHIGYVLKTLSNHV